MGCFCGVCMGVPSLLFFASLLMRQESFSTNSNQPIMKLLTRLLVFPALLLGTTFCSKNQPNPAPTSAVATAGNRNALSIEESTILGVTDCRADTTGTGALLYNEARKLSDTDDDTFRKLKSELADKPSYTVADDGNVSGTNDDERINAYSRNVNETLLKYDDYLAQYGKDGATENPDYVKSIIRDNFERSFNPDDDHNGKLSDIDKEQLRQLYTASKPQMDRALSMYDKLAACDGVKTGARTAAPNGKLISFEEYLQSPAAARSHTSAMRFGFFKALVKAAHIVATVVTNVVSAVSSGMKIGKAICGTKCGVVGGFIGGAVGFIQGIVKVTQNKCQWGPC